MREGCKALTCSGTDCCGHLLEAALAHHVYSHSRRFLDVMIRYVDLLARTFGLGKRQLHGYPGHPELEHAVLRLYSRTRDPKHYAFGQYLVAARGVQEPDLGNRPFFVWEAEQRKDEYFHKVMDTISDGRYHQWHAPLHEQDTMLGHSVRAMYLITAAANLNGALLDDAKRLWTDTVDRKMYPTGGVGSVPRLEGFSEIPHFLPNGEDEGGCYAETCASIGLMMVTERLLSHSMGGMDEKAREVLERCLYNNVLGGASLDGSQFFYDNTLSTSRNEVADRSDWFEVCCCPPNLCRTIGLLGGYAWAVKIDAAKNEIVIDVYLFISATRRIELPNGAGVATVEMTTGMPWKGRTKLDFSAPAGWTWRVGIPRASYTSGFEVHLNGEIVNTNAQARTRNILSAATGTIHMNFEMPVRILSPHPATHQDTLTVTRGPIVYTVETVDNPKLEAMSPHFASLGILESATFTEVAMDIGGLGMVGLETDAVYMLEARNADAIGSMRVVNREGEAVPRWKRVDVPLCMIPFFARANRRKGERIRTCLQRVDRSEVA